MYANHLLTTFFVFFIYFLFICRKNYLNLKIVMKKIVFSLFLCAILLTNIAHLFAQGMGVNTDNSNPDASAILDVKSTTQGMLVPRMTQSQRNLIATPATGLLVYQTDGTAGFYFYNGTAWTSLSGGGSDNLGNHTATTNLTMGNNNITGANNITATGTATLGGNAYPTNTGTNGQVLKTNGAGSLSWGNSGGVSLELLVTKNATVTTAIGNSTVIPDRVSFQTISPKSTLTGGNQWQGDSLFIVGASGEGLYLISVNLVGNAGAIPANPMIDVGESTGSPVQQNDKSYYGFGIAGNLTFRNGQKGRGQLTQLVYLTAGEKFRIRATSGNTAAGAELLANYCKLTVVKLL